MANPSPAGAAPLRSLKILASSFIMAVVLIGVVVVTLGESWDYPDTWVAWVIGGVAVVAHALCELLGYRAPAVAPTEPPAEAMRRARSIFHAQQMMRMALCEVPAIVALVLVFVSTPLTPMTYLIGGVLSLVLMAIHLWPSERVIARVERNLDRDGGQSHLAAALRGEDPSARLL